MVASIPADWSECYGRVRSLISSRALTSDSSSSLAGVGTPCRLPAATIRPEIASISVLAVHRYHSQRQPLRTCANVLPRTRMRRAHLDPRRRSDSMEQMLAPVLVATRSTSSSSSYGEFDSEAQAVSELKDACTRLRLAMRIATSWVQSSGTCSL